MADNNNYVYQKGHPDDTQRLIYYIRAAQDIADELWPGSNQHLACREAELLELALLMSRTGGEARASIGVRVYKATKLTTAASLISLMRELQGDP